MNGPRQKMDATRPHMGHQQKKRAKHHSSFIMFLWYNDQSKDTPVYIHVFRLVNCL